METRVPAKSILKQTTPTAKPTLSDEEKAKAERDRRNLGIALFHANKIQHQKDTQAQILSNIESLLDYPSNTTPTGSSSFTSLVQPFQPSDYDSLVEERITDNKCGYPLCTNSPRSKTIGSSAAWKLKGKGAEDYCSNDCLRKSLYVKSQLSEIPAWEREPGQEPHIVLADDEVAGVDRSDIERMRELTASKAELAIERGETAASFRPGQVMAESVVEKATVSHKPSPSAPAAKASHTAIEGYEPTTKFNSEEDSADPEDWTMDDLIPENEDIDTGDPGAEPEEREAWKDLFDSIEKR